jgi:hypothetical protein
MISHAGQVLDPTASQKNDGVLLENMTLARDVGCHLDAIAQPNSGDLT